MRTFIMEENVSAWTVHFFAKAVHSEQAQRAAMCCSPVYILGHISAQSPTNQTICKSPMHSFKVATLYNTFEMSGFPVFFSHFLVFCSVSNIPLATASSHALIVL